MKRVVAFLLFLIILLFVAPQIKAQRAGSDSLFFTGVVLDQQELIPLPYTHFSINDQTVGLANSYGRFSFWVNAGDTVQYSFVGYQSVKLIISDSLKSDGYLFGVFMVKDTVALEEVLILPRFGNFKQLFVNMKVNTPDYVNARNNVRDVTYKALTTNSKEMDAKANADMAIQSFHSKIENQVMVPPDILVEVRVSRTLPDLEQVKRNQYPHIPDNLITDQEVELLKRFYQSELIDRYNDER